MQVVFVHIHVKPDCVDQFKLATLENAKASIIEPGIARFECFQDKNDATKFILIEAYRSEGDPERHKETAHYAKWRDTVADMMLEPRKGVWYSNIIPTDSDWR